MNESSPSPPPILFLDIDGVLNSHNIHPNGCGIINSYPVSNLNIILSNVPYLHIVLSSAWRYSFPIPISIQSLLMSHGVNCQNRIHNPGRTEFDPPIDLNPFLPENKPKFAELGLKWRRSQILSYVKTHQIQSYVILDDLPLKFPRRTHFVQTDPRCGLLMQDAYKIIAMIQQQINKQTSPPPIDTKIDN